MVTRREAVSLVETLREESLEGRKARRVSVTEACSGRVLAESVRAQRDDPTRSTATMDGYAFDATEAYPFEVVEFAVFPEDDPPTIEVDQAVRVATGAPIPERANAVLKKEEATVENGTLSGPEIEPGTYVYEQGSNVSAGEQLFEPGEQLAPRDAILLHDLGIESVSTCDPFDVGLVATGTEIHEGRSRDLDSPMLAALVRSWGHVPTVEGSAPDEYDRVVRAIEETAASHDVVMTTGGTSVGKKDHVIRALDSLGEVIFHRVRIRPGKPLAAARLPDHDAVAFAIPGKPVGAHTVASLVVRPFFTETDDIATIPATAAADVTVSVPGFEYAIPVRLRDGDAIPLGHATSELDVYGDTFDPSVLSSSTRATRADGFVLTEDGFEQGSTVDVTPHTVLEP
ncbi:molybdopterin molybdotransferase [Halalkaliarchaeum desulfuricum]|uniref:Molybdopterin molybdotransferase n=2 Tax=Halalkaliarchaeum desulfuricum TaxID=2055893 RepID=A0A343TLZ0_9EURY|nr:molybdopterin molybdotransferase [Halalkaliarchaeum desulfuricum]